MGGLCTNPTEPCVPRNTEVKKRSVVTRKEVESESESSASLSECAEDNGTSAAFELDDADSVAVALSAQVSSAGEKQPAEDRHRTSVNVDLEGGDAVAGAMHTTADSGDSGKVHEKRKSLGAAPLEDAALAEMVAAVDAGFTPLASDVPIAAETPPMEMGFGFGMPPIEPTQEPVTTSVGEPLKKRKSIVDELMEVRTLNDEIEEHRKQLSMEKRPSIGFETTFDEPMLGGSPIAKPRTMHEAEEHYSALASEMVADEEESDEEIKEQITMFQQIVQGEIDEVDADSEKSAEEKKKAKLLIRQQSMYKWSTTHIDTQKEEMMQQLLFLQAAGGKDDDLRYMQQLLAQRELSMLSVRPSAISEVSPDLESSSSFDEDYS